MTQFTIVPMRAESAADIVKISEECGLSRWSEIDYATEASRKGSYAYQAEVQLGSEVVGFVVMRLITNKKGSFPAIYEILNIAVKKNKQKTGVGNALLETCINLTKQDPPTEIWLEVRNSNASAIRFYEKHGFRTQNIRRNFYSAPIEDGIVMKLDVY